MGGPRGVLADAVQRIVGREPVARVDHLRHCRSHQAVSAAPETLSDAEPRRRGRRGIPR